MVLRKEHLKRMKKELIRKLPAIQREVNKFSRTIPLGVDTPPPADGNAMATAYAAKREWEKEYKRISALGAAAI